MKPSSRLCWRALIATALLLAVASAAIFRPAAIMQRTPHPNDFAEDEDVLAEWEAEDWDFMQDDDEIHASFNPPRRKANSFFSAVVDDSRDAASKLQNQLSDASDQAASWYEREKHEAKDWLGRFRHSAEKVSDKVSDELSANYYRARGKARSAYHDAANQYYRAKSKMRHTGHEGGDALFSWKNHLLDTASSESDSMRDEIDRMKNRQWLRELGRVLDTEPFEGSRFGAYRPRSWFRRASAEAEDKVEDAYDKGKGLYTQARHKAEDAYWRAKQTAEDAAHRARRRFWS